MRPFLVRKNPLNLPCSVIAQAQIIGNHGYAGFGTYVKLLQLMWRMPDRCLPKDDLVHVAQSNGMELFIVEHLLETPALFVSDQTRYFAVDSSAPRKEKVVTETPEVPLEHPLQMFVKYGDDKITFPRINTLPTQLSAKDCVNLITMFPKKLIRETLEAMENWGPLTEGSRKKSSVYLTIMVWSKRALKDGWVERSAAPIRATGAPVRANA